MRIVKPTINILPNLSYFRLIVILVITFTGALWLYTKGPIPVIRGTIALDEIVPLWYMLSAFPVLGMLVADFLAAIVKYHFGRRTIVLFSQIFLLVIISNIRLSLKIPISGHAFLFAFFILHRIFARDFNGLSSRAELIFTVALLLIIGYIKLVWWTDLLTLSVGIISGIVLASIGALFPGSVRS